ncbi:MAG: endolytic transglycosylase MltG [Pseudomonadota bacterium]
MGRHFAANGMTLLIVVMILAFGVISWGRGAYVAPGPMGSTTCVQVLPGSTMNRVSEQLQAQGVISSATVFRIGANYTERSDQLKAGSFIVPDGSSMDEITDIITRGGQSTCGTEIVYRIGVRDVSVQVREFDAEAGGYVEQVSFLAGEPVPEAYREARDLADVRYRVVVAEGGTTQDTAAALLAADFLEGTIGELPAEGMLAPDSYEVVFGSDRSALIERMRSAQEARIADAWSARSADLPFDTPTELLTLASIIEKETGVAEERRVVSAVFVNRMRRGMRLQTDPTIIYGITRGAGLLDRPIRRSDIDGVTEQRTHGAVEYNTYQIDGLPPGPIANPGIAALQAAADPDSTPYIFFVADGTGGHAFAETLEEHNRNVAAFRALDSE